ncbi:unnamed protein product [Adineta steineri]|uniref:Aminotransferase class I/classII large domain-containing protein n=2 Tax=Adineta steineri TaxID=433720 RepID=A0A815F1A9_9BILA|nr:unnamed protein product [Adineta steineri]CAF3666688.1 unnamed protein product [Adineta steineri]
MTSKSTLCSIFGIESSSRVDAHYEGARTHLLNSNEILRRTSHEQELYANYIAAGEPAGPTIYSSKGKTKRMSFEHLHIDESHLLGEHFTEVCPSLKHFIDHELKLDLKYFGYMEYAFGLEEHRQILKKLMIRHHELDDEFVKPENFEVGCLMNSTRLIMFDLGRVIVDELEKKGDKRQPVVLSFQPGWDYTGVYESLKMKVLHLPLTPRTEFVPDLKEWSKYLDEQKPEKIDLVIINTQHNPTGKQWSLDVVNFLMDLAWKHESYLLIDDAYYCVHDPRVEIVNTLKIWLKRLAQHKNSAMAARWLHTHPFGKQFNCNALGMAMISSSPQLMAQLNTFYWHHSYLNGCVNAEILCQWLSEHQQDAEQFIVDNGMEIARKKSFVCQFMEQELSYPSTSLCTGPSTSYLIFEVPLIYSQDSTKKKSEIAEQFSDDLYYATGVMLSGDMFTHAEVAAYVRLHLGSDPANIEEILRRFKASGLNYHMKHKLGVAPGLAERLLTKLHNLVTS